jgi:hypothetical protein
METRRIPEQVEIDGVVYRPHVEIRNGLPWFSGRWYRLVRPTPIAFSFALYFNGVQLPTLAVLTAHRDLPKQLR